MEHGLPLLCDLALLASGARPGRGPRAGPGGARSWNTAALGRGPGPRGALLRQGPGAEPRGDAGDRSSPPGRGAGGHRGPRRADRPRLAAGRPAGRGPGDGAAACDPGPSPPSGRRRHGGAPGAARARGRGPAPAGPHCRARGPVPAGPGAGRRCGSGNVSAETPPMAQRQADALALLAETALHHGLDPGAPGERYQVVVHVDAPALADPDQPGQCVLEGGAHVSAEPTMWLAPLPVALKLSYNWARRVQRSVTLLVPTEPDAEPDPGRFEVPRSVDTALAL